MAEWGSSELLEAGTHAEIEFTGERVIPGHVDADLWNEHISRYAFARRFAERRRVLDVGCGTGYGAALLAETAEHVTGIDFAEEALQYARAHYGRSNLSFVRGDATDGLEGKFDLITAFEVIEHLDDWSGLLQAARRQLAAGGLLFVSTPNKPYYAESRGESGRNPFHVHEFEYQEFQGALRDVFPNVTMLMQNHSEGMLFAPVEPGAGAAFEMPVEPPDASAAHFFLAVCAVEPLPSVENFFWLPSTANVLRERDRHIALLRGEVELKSRWIEAGRAELTARNREYEELLGMFRNLQNDLEARNRWSLEQDEQLRARGERIKALQAELEEAHEEFARTAAAYEDRTMELEQVNRAKTEWALETERRLTAECEDRSRQVQEYAGLLERAERTVEERTLWAQGLDREIKEWQERYSALRRSFWVRAGSRLHLVADRK